MADTEQLTKAQHDLDAAIQAFVTAAQGEGFIVTDWMLTTEETHLNAPGSAGLFHWFSETMTKWNADGIARRALPRIIEMMSR